MRHLERFGPGPGDSDPRSSRSGNLTVELSSFVGRAAELEELRGVLEAERLVTVTGVGGVGKSRLAARAASLAGPRDGVWMVELASLQEAELVEYAVAEALELTDHTSRPPRQVLFEHLAERRLLLVLDGFEHLVDASGSLVRDLLGRAPGLRVLAVGRRPLGIEGERLFPLCPMAVEEAAELFADRAATILPDFTLDAGSLPDVLEVCRRLDGIPLAVELAAGRLRALSLAQLLSRLDDRFGLLTGDGSGALPRHQTMRTAIGWSHELCTPDERLLWARLSVFSGHFDLEAAEYVCGGHGLPEEAVLDVLGRLLAQSLVAREETPAGVRYRMLDTVRAYGADWLEAMGDGPRLRRRHRDWYMGLATWCELDWFSPRQPEVAARVEADLPNLRIALDHCLSEPGEAHVGQHLASTLWFCWVGCGRLAEGRHWLERSLELGAGHMESRLKALWVLAYVAILQGDMASALAALHECREGAERHATAAACAMHRTGCLALVTDDMPRAEQLLREALDRYHEIGELNSYVLMCQVELAMAMAFQGNLPGAVELCEDVRLVCEDHGERWTRAYALFVLAYAAWADGRLDRARELLEQSLAIHYGFQDLLGTVLTIELLALVTVAEGDPVEAAVLQGVAGRIWPSVGLPLFGSSHFNAPHQLCEELVREQLGDTRYEEFRGAGGRLGTDAAVARVLSGHRADPRGLLPHQREPMPDAETSDGAPDMRKPAASPTQQGGDAAG
ncbi:ATP-binding protein [Streptomyces jeddahensis]|uniref:Putative HTH-type transcriptional regulatorc n=1 Tax=Streptomyces jeddahensis TaxID=1716141 RepID=A0A177HTZ4_9ACTN|nr:tetratricopeptide repeat protein [Streptomyces jeddahensis]OAH14186.1 putative HTH-type transcriptional regulatorc [Streptomyces jeddahensis]